MSKAYKSQPMDFTGCDPVIAEALQRGRKVETEDDGCIVYYGGGDEYWLEDGDVYNRNEFTLIPDNTPQPGELCIFWGAVDAANPVVTIGPLGDVNAGWFIPQGCVPAFDRCARFEARLMGLAPKDYPEDVEVFGS